MSVNKIATVEVEITGGTGANFIKKYNLKRLSTEEVGYDTVNVTFKGKLSDIVAMLKKHFWDSLEDAIYYNDSFFTQYFWHFPVAYQELIMEQLKKAVKK